MRTTWTRPNERLDAWAVAHPAGSDTVKRLCLDAQAGIDALESIALAAGLPATATPAEVVARVERLRGYVNDMAEHDCAYGDGCVSTARHGRCVGCSARIASEAGR